MTNRQLAAYHEAGHVVMALAMEFPPTAARVERCTECSIEDDCWIGSTAYGTEDLLALPDDGPSGLARYIVLCASGVVAEDYVNGAPIDGSGGYGDEVAASQAAFVLAYAVDLKLARAVMEAAPGHARDILTAPDVWPAVVAVAETLDKMGDLDAEGIARAVAAHEDAIDAARAALYRATSSPLLGR